MHQFWPSVTKGWVGGRRGGAGRGGEWEGRWKKLPGEDTGPPVALTTQLDRRDTIPVEDRIPGWLHPIGTLHRCQCIGHGFTMLKIYPPEKQTN